MRALVVAATLMLGLLTAPAAHALSATLTSPADGATYYTGTQFTAPVPWSGSFDFSPCSGSNFYIGKVERWDGANPPAGDWPSNGGNSTGSISGTNTLFPGEYHYKAAALCALDTVYSSAVTIHVVSGSAPTISDRDLDGVTDTGDQCPDVPGVAANNGCPVLDAPAPQPAAPAPPPGDKDDVPADKDKCDEASGPAWHEGCPVRVPPAPKRKPELRARTSSTCSPAKLRSERKAKAPKLDAGARVAKLTRCYAKGVPGVPDGWPLIRFWSNANFKPGFVVFPPELRPENAPPITSVALRAKPGFNVYAVKRETAKTVLSLPVFSILTAEGTPTNTGGRLQVGVIFPARGSVGTYKRIAL